MRRRIVYEARKWIGTPYLHQASVIHQGADCLGLIRGVWRKTVGPEPEQIPGYSSDWGEISGKEPMLDAAQKWFVPIEVLRALSGDIVLFRWKPNAPVKHAGILTSSNRFIHAYEKAGVVETTLGTHWKSRLVTAFRFPVL